MTVPSASSRGRRLPQGRVPGRWTRTTKRAFDIAIAGMVLLVTSPLLLLVAVAIKCTSPGPVLYR
ncbi:MAG TPA: sugar transferase, partial [Planctomycetota bacterium]|nr:sugar transferase [Planctomycetota bacterium]